MMQHDEIKDTSRETPETGHKDGYALPQAPVAVPARDIHTPDVSPEFRDRAHSWIRRSLPLLERLARE